MNFNTEALSRSIGRTILKTKKNSPHILFVAGVMGVVGSTVLACKSTLKLSETLDTAKQDFEAVRGMHNQVRVNGTPYTEKEYRRDLSYVYIKTTVNVSKLYGPAVLIGGASIAALTGSHIILTRRNAVLTFTLTAMSKAYEEYRDRVKEELGEERELEIYQGIQEKKVEIDGKKELVKVVNPNSILSPYARFFEGSNRNWNPNLEYNRIFIECQQTYANDLLKARGHVFLNDVYDMLGFDRTSPGSVVGWIRHGDGDGFVDFGLYDVANMDFINENARGCLLDFNVDGVVYDKI